MHSPELNLHLVGGKDLKLGRPYPNRHYQVATKRSQRKHYNGIVLNDTSLKVGSEFTVTATWAIESLKLELVHVVSYLVVDGDSDGNLLSTCMLTWGKTPVSSTSVVPDFHSQRSNLIEQPCMEVCRTPSLERLKRVVDKRCSNTGYVIQREEPAHLPVISHDRYNYMQEPLVLPLV